MKEVEKDCLKVLKENDVHVRNKNIIIDIAIQGRNDVPKIVIDAISFLTHKGYKIKHTKIRTVQGTIRKVLKPNYAIEIFDHKTGESMMKFIDEKWIIRKVMRNEIEKDRKDGIEWVIK